MTNVLSQPHLDFLMMDSKINPYNSNTTTNNINNVNAVTQNNNFAIHVPPVYNYGYNYVQASPCAPTYTQRPNFNSPCNPTTPTINYLATTTPVYSHNNSYYNYCSPSPSPYFPSDSSCLPQTPQTPNNSNCLSSVVGNNTNVDTSRKLNYDDNDAVFHDLCRSFQPGEHLNSGVQSPVLSQPNVVQVAHASKTSLTNTVERDDFFNSYNKLLTEPSQQPADIKNTLADLDFFKILLDSLDDDSQLEVPKTKIPNINNDIVTETIATNPQNSLALEKLVEKNNIAYAIQDQNSNATQDSSTVSVSITKDASITKENKITPTTSESEVKAHSLKPCKTASTIKKSTNTNKVSKTIIRKEEAIIKEAKDQVNTKKTIKKEIEVGLIVEKKKKRVRRSFKINKCTFCGTSDTPYYRKSQCGQRVCNRCGLAERRQLLQASKTNNKSIELSQEKNI
eukprot:Awhi_evm1s10919